MILPHEPIAMPGPPLDLDLIRKYSVAGPRYTSYPPATRFKDDFDREKLEASIAADNREGAGPLSLYFHLPFCESLCWYCGCNTVITRRRASAREYLGDVERELALTASRLRRGRPVKQIHLGGGTPTFFPPEELARLGLLIYENFELEPDCEFSVEIDPRGLTREHVDALRVIGVNRASLGVQDTDPKVQVAIHRWQPAELNRQAVAWLRAAGFRSVSVDLIYGLPKQTASSFGRTIDEVLTLGPDRLSVFSYAHVPWIKPAQRVFEARGDLPAPEEKLAMAGVAHERLTRAGYVDIGLDHFARPDDELSVAQRSGTLQRNFQGYSTAAGASLYGFGVSSISSTADSYRQNFKTLGEWRAALDEGRLPVERALILTEEDRRRRVLIMGLMCDRRLDYAALSAALGVDVALEYAKEISGLADLEADGLLVRTAEGIEVLPRGVALLRVIAMRFDATFVPGAGRHAQTV
ncbi:MAG TPA: oxygen-independent coproporphyrinogen III oxidase [Opitutaceae bacterium]|nr:oxygen-independent coproporphyrinogen III oxidase [Opitutaceae bacterium]